MLSVCLKILFILGMILLAVLAVITAVLLLVLFFPVTYRFSGAKDTEGLRLTVKVNWLFGLFRVRFQYPDPGRLRAKALFFTLFDMKIPPGDAAEGETSEKKKEGKEKKAGIGKKAEKEKKPEKEQKLKKNRSGSAESERKNFHEEKAGTDDFSAANCEAEDMVSVSAGKAQDSGNETENVQVSGESIASASEEGGWSGKISGKVQKIIYTIHGIYDKIKKIWENISYYMELLQEEDTKQLFSHALYKGGKILKSIRPGHLKADILFGTGSPDTTGYFYGMYCALASVLGTGFWVTPDFDQKILEGSFEAAGRIRIWVLVLHSVRLLLDKRLRRLLRKIKAGPGKAPA